MTALAAGFAPAPSATYPLFPLASSMISMPEPVEKHIKYLVLFFN